MRFKFLLTSVAFQLMIITVTAQKTEDLPIELQSCNITVTAGKLTSTTVLELTFYNPNNKVLDGEHNFSLQQGQLITGFALDINGHFREGVIVDKQQGRIAYENTIRRRIDPGLLELTSGNNYRLRIYPMPAKGIRKAKITITGLLAAKETSLQYYLPLTFKSIVNEVNISCTVQQPVAAPVTTAGLLKGQMFNNTGSGYQLQFSGKHISGSETVSFEIPLLQTNHILCVQNNGSKNFALLAKVPADATPAPTSIAAITVFWDVSASAASRNIEKEIAFLKEYVTAKKTSTITVVTFSNEIHETKTFKLTSSGSNDVFSWLRSLTYDGGTCLGTIDCNQYNGDQYLLFSDGLGNFGNDDIKTNGKTLYCINSSANANHTLLSQAAAFTNASYVDLSRTDIDNALTQMDNNSARIAFAKQAGAVLDIISPFAIHTNEWFLVTGQLHDTTNDIELKYYIQNEDIGLSRLSLKQAAGTAADIDAALLINQYENTQTPLSTDEDVTLFAKSNRIVSKTTSFIVLDNIEDYIQYGIVPPADLQEEYAKRLYVVIQKEEALRKAKANEETDNLKKAATQYNDLIRWWDKNEPLINPEDVMLKREIPITYQEVKAPKDNNNTTQVARSFTPKGGNALTEVIVTALGISRKAKDLGYAVSTINNKTLVQARSVNIAQALNGKVSGLNISTTTSGVIEDAKINIRGIRSLTGNNNPMLVVDGSPTPLGFLSSIPPDDVASLTVLKSAASAALYGPDAVNGAIVITTKRSAVRRPSLPSNPVYQQLDDMDYVNEMRGMTSNERYDHYLDLRDSFAKDPSYYFDVAKFLYNRGDKKTAVRVLSNLCEIQNENHQLLRTAGYVLEEWKMYPEAIEIYKKVLNIKEEEPQSYRDLANAYERNGDHQLAVDWFYKSITKNYYQYEDRYRGIKALMLEEMNAIIIRNRGVVCLSNINEAIIKPLPVDLRIVIDWNKDETDIDLHVEEPNGETCYYGYRDTKKGGHLAQDFTQGYGPEEYQVKNAQKGKYRIRIHYYGDRYQKEQVPAFVKMTVYKNFGRPDQTIYTETFNMDNLSGEIEIGTVKFR